MGVEEEDCVSVDQEGRLYEFGVVFCGIRQSCFLNGLPIWSYTLTCISDHIPIVFDAMRYFSFRVYASPTAKNMPCPPFMTTI